MPKFPAAAHGPEQLRVLLRAGGHQLPVHCDHVHREQVVAGQAVLPLQHAHAAAEGEARDAGLGNLAAGHGEPVDLGLAVHIAQRRPGLGAHGAARGIDVHPRIRDRSTRSPPSQVPWPAMLCPPPRTAMGRPASRAWARAASTSAVSRQRTMSAGRRSIIALKTRRTVSYSGSAGVISCPRSAVRSCSMAGNPQGRGNACLASCGCRRWVEKAGGTAARRCDGQARAAAASARRRSMNSSNLSWSSSVARIRRPVAGSTSECTEWASARRRPPLVR